MFEKAITDKQITGKQLSEELKPTDNCLTDTPEQLRRRLTELPFTINPQFQYAVIGHIQYFGWSRVKYWASIAATKTYPERWFMKVLSRQRYGK